MLFAANFLSWLLAIGWWFSSIDRWEPAIVFVGLSAALAQQIRARFTAGEKQLGAGQKRFVLAVIFIALFITKPSKEAHLGALMKSESDRAAARMVERLESGGRVSGIAAAGGAAIIGRVIGNTAALRSSYYNIWIASFAVGHSLSIGVMGYVLVLNRFPHLLPSFSGERYLAQTMAAAREHSRKTQAQQKPASSAASAASH